MTEAGGEFCELVPGLTVLLMPLNELLILSVTILPGPVPPPPPGVPPEPEGEDAGGGSTFTEALFEAVVVDFEDDDWLDCLLSELF